MAVSQETSTSLMFKSPRGVLKKVLSVDTPAGKGATVRRSIGRPELQYLDPFLMLDFFTVKPPAGFPTHAHRGFETVTYMLEGSFNHEDFTGRKGIINAGDVQWMTAGRGIVHSEMPATEGWQRGLQLWVNLAAEYKMVEPAYQEVEEKDVPKVEIDGMKVSVIAGESYGSKSPAFTRTPIMFLRFSLQPGASAHQAIPEGWNAFLYIYAGKATVGSEREDEIDTHHAVQLGSGDGVSVWNKSSIDLSFVLIGGQPLNEPVLRRGPFVMNTEQEITDTLRDLELGKNGFERAPGWKSST